MNIKNWKRYRVIGTNEVVKRDGRLFKSRRPNIDDDPIKEKKSKVKNWDEVTTEDEIHTQHGTD